jgi:electron transfer flavoprotein alpha subunit
LLAINPDANAPVFEHADVGIVGEWEQAVPLLVRAINA